MNTNRIAQNSEVEWNIGNPIMDQRHQVGRCVLTAPPGCEVASDHAHGGLRTASPTHPAGRSPDSHVRELKELDSRGQSCPRSGGRMDARRWIGFLRTGLALFLFTILSAITAHAQFDNFMPDDDDALLYGTENVTVNPTATWAVSEPYINLWITSQPLPTQNHPNGSQCAFTLVWKQRNSRSTYPSFNFGPGWECSWLGYTQGGGPLKAPLGGSFSYSVYSVYNPTPYKEFWTTATMENSSADGNTYIVHKPSGAMDVYASKTWQGNGLPEGMFMLWRRKDPRGNIIQQFDYDGWYSPGNSVVLLNRVWVGTMQFNLTYGYNQPGTNSFWATHVTRITDYYGRTVGFGYDAQGRLTSVTNSIGLVDRYYYDAAGFITNMTTVNGATTFAATTNVTGSYNLGGNNTVNRSLLVTNPDGSRELFAYRDQSTKLYNGSTTDLIPSSYPAGEVPGTSPLSNTFDNVNMDARNSFHWNPLQFSLLSSSFTNSPSNFNLLTVADYKHATLTHWLKDSSLSYHVKGVPSMLRAGTADGSTDGPKTWLDYAGKTAADKNGTNRAPSFVAALQPDGSSRFALTERTNFWEKPTRNISTWANSAGTLGTRTNWFAYSTDGLDLLTVTNFLGQQVLSNLFNASHQATTSYNALNERTDFSYSWSVDMSLEWVHWPSGLATTNFYAPYSPKWLSYTRNYDGASGTLLSSRYFLDAYGVLYCNLDERGRTFSLGLDNLNRPTTLTYPGSTFTAAYTDVSGNPKVELQKVTDPLSNYTRLTYDSLSRVCLDQDRCGHLDKACYANGVLCSTTNTLNEVTTFNYDRVGRLIKLTYHDGASETNRYDFLGRLTNRIDAAGAAVTNYYNHQGLLLTASNAFGRLVLNQYDLLDRLTNSVDAAGLAVGAGYDALDRVARRTYPDATSEGYGYSARGLTAYTNRLGKVTTYGLDVMGRRIAETNANGEITRYAYNAGSDLTQVIDAKNQTNTWSYDQFGRMTNWVDASGAIIQTNAYDSLGRLSQRWTPAKGSQYFTYGAEGNLLSYSPSWWAYQYDALHRLTNFYQASVITNGFSYTSWGALAAEDGPWDNDTIAYTYTNHRRTGLSLQQPNASPWTLSYGYDAAGRLQSVTDPNGAYTYSYPNPSGMVNKLVFPTGSYVTNVFDTLNRIIGTYLKRDDHTLRNSHVYQFNAENQRTKHTRMGGDFVDYTYDNIGQLKTALGKESGGSSRLNEQFGFNYDAANNLNQRTNNALVQTFGVNSRNQLTTATRAGTLTVAGVSSATASSVTVNGSAATIYGDKTFAKTGMTLADGNNTFTAVGTDSLGRGDTNSITFNLPATVNYTYDANGNLTGDGLRTYGYDVVNRLASMTVANNSKTDLVYDAFGRQRIRYESNWVSGAWAKVSETRYVYDGRLVLQERDGSNTPKVTYTRGLDLSGSFEGAGGIGGLLARTDQSSGAPAFYHADGNGNVTMLINSYQLPVAKYLYDSFGNTLAMSGPLADANTYRFSSKELHPASGLINFGERWYHPNLQRFMSRDPSGMSDGPNLYAYVRNRPSYGIDPFGQFTLIAPIIDANQLLKNLAFTEAMYMSMFSPALVNLAEVYANPRKVLAQAKNFRLFGLPYTDDELEEMIEQEEDEAALAAQNYIDPGVINDISIDFFGNAMLVSGLIRGAAFQVGARGAAVTTTASRIAANATAGNAFEQAVFKVLGLTKEYTKVTAPGLGTSIPDIVARTAITEIKNRITIMMTKQLEIQIASLEGRAFNLIVSPRTTTISKSVQIAVERSGGTIKVFDPASGVFRSWP